MAPIIKIIDEKTELANRLAVDFTSLLQQLIPSREYVTVALSGGSTPGLFFKAMVDMNPPIDWNKVRFFWVDERCVPADHAESNFGAAFRDLLKPLAVPESNYYRIRGEDNPDYEARRYAQLIRDAAGTGQGIPIFDFIFLGMGTDGHTASIFPHQVERWEAEDLCTVGNHPETGQQRVTFSGRLINAAARVIFHVTGREKGEIARMIIKKNGDYTAFPASRVNPSNGELLWYLDAEAAGTWD
ncbi:MAG: 6-phosphogluconolactonase [Bacteroidales bacterium]|nr:6-phosphogluconolactonase [Bacteroidales bacterium]